MKYNNLRHLVGFVMGALMLSLASCMEWDYGDVMEDFNASGSGLFITNEGNFQYGNASLLCCIPKFSLRFRKD